MAEARFEIASYDFASAARLVDALGVSHVTAQILVRRGCSDPDAARAFLAADVRHALSTFAGLAEAAKIVLRHLEAGSRLTVHGDYDVDGVCSTAVLVRALRTLGGHVDWYLPSRIEDGYGLAAPTIDRLADRGTQLLIAVDCGITAVEEVAHARARGMEVVVCDHHAPRADGRMPSAEAIVHPRVAGGNPYGELCATAVAWKLAGALLEAAGHDPALADVDLDVVALATVADVVPLLDENRALVRAGLKALKRTSKPGLRALMEVARVDPSSVDATAIGFRLAPRLNAAGRVARADAALELLLTEDDARARAVAEELDVLNQRRRDVETRILFAAEAQVRELGDVPAYVLVGEDWHPGVIGIVASRIAERRMRPTILIAMDGEAGTGSGRSIPAFDLLAGFEAGARHLLRHGGHRAAAGLTIARGEIDAFRDAFCAHAAEVLRPEDLVPAERVDAVAGADALDMALAEELQRLEPFGAGNPPVSLLVPAAVCRDGQAMGEGERHVRFRLGSARAVRFGEGVFLPEGCVDACVRLEVNAWNGSVEPRVLLRRTRRCESGIELLGGPFVARALRHARAGSHAVGGCESARTVVDARGRGVMATIADLVASGDRVLVVAVHAEHRAAALRGRVGGFAITDWHEVVDHASGYDHVVALDPRLFDAEEALPGDGHVHLAYGEQELSFAQAIHEWEHTLLDPMRQLYRDLRSGVDPDAALRGHGTQPNTPARAGRLLRSLAELDLLSLGEKSVSLRPDPPTKLDPTDSPTFRESEAWLSRTLPMAA